MRVPALPTVSRPSGSRRACRGLTLVELMVSLVLGLVITLAIMTAYLSSSRAAQVADAVARMHDDATAVLALLRTQIRMAGNNPERPLRAAAAARNPVYAGPGVTKFAIRGCDGVFDNLAAAAKIDDLTCPSPGNAPDSLAITYEADPFNTAAIDGGAVPLDCAGFPLDALIAAINVYDPVSNIPAPANFQFYFSESRFYVATGSDGVPRLMCRGNGASSEPAIVAENVEDFQIAYGLLSPTAAPGSSAVAGYLPAAAMATQAELLALSEPDRWSKVASVRICLLLRSPAEVVHDADSAKYVDCSGALVAAPDLRLRRAFRATVAVRGRT
ncbi:PilW family protein [Ramlibacter humi]|uniref:Prepilin-type N-terminal cleavage/methylation domain-containing protein n=1 Tax=Ramlibacter humi TaxID=2530451 RepID=A0A4Z0BQE2_9BURK|nr:PilW family protein [Ramlibacter humi]TFZ00265.1 hypothetical protein EZ216_14290 [Ramlibacter humi]